MAIGPPLEHATGLLPDLTAVPLHGIAFSQVILVTRTGDRSRLVAAFHRHAGALLTGTV
ncbi:hypothetical protein HMPREF1211_08556 [Streptomyces sp. HGB0020]|nr:hypothetical protein HMPREF1211_08556 [Streptomyces sp. HGB0020]